MVDEAKSCKNLSDVIGRHTKLKKRGPVESFGLCPFHDERSPSFEVNDAKGLFYCHGCGASGDHFKALTALDGMTFREAYEALTNDTFPTVSEEERARQRAEDALIRAAAIDDARLMWRAGVSVEGTPGETYLRDIRGITMTIPDTVRFGHVPTSRDAETGHWKRPLPAVLFACTDDRDEIIGLQRIFIRDDGGGKRWDKRSKLSIGRPRGSAVKLAPAADEVILCEGPEDGLTLAQELSAAPVWVALGTAMMPEVRFPDIVKRICIAGQNDKAGRAAVAASAVALAERGMTVRTMFPAAAYKDWNDQLRGIRI
ncbi:CHC2 zinc finger domain-containing protein [Sphingomonas sp. MMS24-J13]|uniref:CHC2 zinc finger domain-containing protein n=1 Tax=Sphingomonas sp. MMS24-J13 TaxID=3238686 RepID=UPI00384F820C